ncbi:Uncharacterized protein Adt_27374 [Abeliophyllum distichum]|uniref:Endonuclease/exonuclease/phosphatase domain-containing protein n=1 Tax=Abeliophyllum distichum TaxID=126358 RepID=A0ABD1RUA2_9LAMI
MCLVTSSSESGMQSVGWTRQSRLYDSDPTPAHRDTLHQAQAGLNQTLSVEEAFWKQKAGARWLLHVLIIPNSSTLELRIPDCPGRCILPQFMLLVRRGRRDLWMGLHQISLVVDGPWMVGGDFNVIAHNGERTGHNTRDRGTSDFADMMMDCGLTDAGYSGSQYTWTNGRVWKRLDRVLINSAVGSSCSRFSVRHLNRSTSNHSPLLIEWSSDDDLGPRPFRFLNVWSRHHDFLSFVSQK